MCATCSRRLHHGPRRQRGFTLVELLTVVVLAAVMAVSVLPRLDGASLWRASGWRAQVQSALRYAGTSAQAHRRLVCASIAADAVTLSIANANPASACSVPLLGPDGDTRYAHDSAAPATAVVPAGLLYFQPDGRLTSDGAGALPTDRLVTLAGETSISLSGATAHVR